MPQDNENAFEHPAEKPRVGYGVPPGPRRFKDSGNPAGRPKGAKGRKTIVKTVAGEMHTVTEDGKQRRRSTLELVLLRLRNKALEGKHVRAFDTFHALLKRYGVQESEEPRGCLVVSTPMEDDEWIAQMEAKNALMEKHGVRNFGEAKELERQEQERKKAQAAS